MEISVYKEQQKMWGKKLQNERKDNYRSNSQLR